MSDTINITGDSRIELDEMKLPEDIFALVVKYLLWRELVRLQAMSPIALRSKLRR